MRFSTHRMGAVLAAVLVLTTLPLDGQVLLNELMSDNEVTLADVDGDFSDWIELYNPGPDDAVLDGYHLTDDPNDLTAWQFGELTLAPGEYRLVFASDKDRNDPGAELHTNFKLANAGEYLALVEADGITIASEFAPAFLPLGDDAAFGIGAGGAELGLMARPTPGAANAAIAVRPEIVVFAADRASIPFGASVTVSWQVEHVDGVSIDGLSLPPTGSLVVTPDRSRYIGLHSFNVAGFKNDAIWIEVGPEIPAIHAVTATPATIVPGGRTVLRWEVSRDRTPTLDDGFGGELSSPLVYTPFNEVLIGARSDWHYLADGSDQGTPWRLSGFDDVGWGTGPGALGFGGGEQIETEIGKAGTTVYFRRPFSVADVTPLRGLTLRLLIEDGAAAYLNGTELLRHRLPAEGPLTPETPAGHPHGSIAPLRYLEFEVDSALLIEGLNQLAVEVHKTSPFDDSLLFDAGLTAWRSKGPEARTLNLIASNAAGAVSAPFTVSIAGPAAPLPSLPSLALTEFIWDIDAAFEIGPLRFFEIFNLGAQPVDLTGLQLIGSASSPPVAAGTSLAPGSYALFVARRSVFEDRWGEGLPVISDSFETAIDVTGGTRFGLLTPDGQSLEQFTYVGPPAHGVVSHERLDLFAPPAYPQNWRGGERDGASPGEREIPRIRRFEVNDEHVRLGDVVTFDFEVEAAQSARIDPDIGEIPIGVWERVQIPIVQLRHRNYTLTARGKFATVTKTIEIRVQPVINSFTATPLNGGAVRLNWDIAGDDLFVSISGIGTFSTGTGSVVVGLPEDELVAPESEWSYLDNGSDQGIDWIQPGFDDTAWNRGAGILGYGNAIEQTEIQRGDFLTYYFRHYFTVHDPAGYQGLFLDLLVDDGARVFLNATEVLRENLPVGEIDYRTRSSGPSPDDGRTYDPSEIDLSALVPGDNLLAVEVHNNIPNAADVGFDLRLRGIAAPPAGSQRFHLLARNGGSNETVVATVPADPGPAQFANWAAAMGIPDAEPQNDDDGDGRSNLLEFLLGSRPDVYDLANPLQVRAEFGHLLLEYEHNPAAQFLAAGLLGLELEVSFDLRTWIPATGLLSFEGSVAGEQPGAVRSTYRSVLPMVHDHQPGTMAFRLGRAPQ